MLTLTGTVLDITTETVTPPPGAGYGTFESTTVAMLVGKSKIERVRLGRDFPHDRLPKEGQQAALIVGVKTFLTRNGSGYSFTAFEPAASAPSTGARVAAVAAAN